MKTGIIAAAIIAAVCVCAAGAYIVMNNNSNNSTPSTSDLSIYYDGEKVNDTTVSVTVTEAGSLESDITVKYNGTDVTSSSTISGIPSTITGGETFTVTATYSNHTAKFTVSVAEEGLAVYYNGTKINDTTLLLTKTKAATIASDVTVTMNGTDVTSSSTVTGVPETITEGSSFTVTVTYETNTATFTVSVSSPTSFTIEYQEGTEDCYTITENASGEYTVTFNNLTETSEYSITGTLTGNIVVYAGDYELILDLEGVTIVSSVEAPIAALSGDTLTLSAKKGTVNTVEDDRAAVTEESQYSACIYSVCDLHIQGKGTLNVTSADNNGIHTKDDLKVKNLTLTVTCQDNALKGNDSVNIVSGTITLTANDGDAIKTTNSDTTFNDGTIKKQKGIVYVNSDEGATVLTIYSANDGIDAAYDVLISEAAKNSVTLSIYTSTYAGYKTSSTDSSKGIKAADSVTISGGTVLIKSYDDALHANADEVDAKDALGQAIGTGTGNLTVSGGTITLYTKDDGIHADGTLTVSGGTITVSECYEGLEGEYIIVSDGNISVTSSDDGFNSTATTGTGITISGGRIYVYAGGDGLDSNTTTSYKGIVISGGYLVSICTSRDNSALDTENGYTYSGGYVVALNLDNSGMAGGECTKCQNFNSIGKMASINGTKGSYVTVTDGNETCVVKLPTALKGLVVLGFTVKTISYSVDSSTKKSLDSNGVFWS